MLKDTLCCYLSRVAVLSLYEHLSAAVCKRPAGIYRLLPDVTLQTKKQVFQNFYIFDEHFAGKIPFFCKFTDKISKNRKFCQHRPAPAMKVMSAELRRQAH